MGKTAAQIKADLATIEARLKSGVVSVSVDGHSTRVDVDSLRKEQARLLAELGRIEGETSRRPTASSIDLGGF